MASTLTLQLDLKDYPEAPTLGVLAAVDGTTHHVALIQLHEPISTAGMARIMQTVTRRWVEPELALYGEDALEDYLAAIGERKL